MKNLYLVRLVVAGLAVVYGAGAIAQDTTVTHHRRGAVLEELQMPTSASRLSRTPEKTELEKHEEKKEFFRNNPGRAYDPNTTEPPPPQLRHLSAEEQEKAERKRKARERSRTPTMPEKDASTSGSASVRMEGASDAAVRDIGNTLDAKGPGPLGAGQTENVTPNNRVVGAANALACHPISRTTLYAGFTNGGIWKTVNSTSPNPDWVPQTDNLGSLSIGAVEFDPTDPTGETLIAGIGRFSSLASHGGQRLGLLVTTNGGDNWTVIDGGGSLRNKNFAGVAKRGDIIVGAVNTAEPFVYSSIGILRSTNGGNSFVNVALVSGSGLPQGRAFDLQGDPNTTTVLYTAIRDAGDLNGIYKSTNTGETWARVSDATMNAMITDLTTNNIHISVSPAGSTYVAIANSGKLAGVFGSFDGGGTWTNLGVPTTTENGKLIGVHPGGQSSIHLSIAADPVNPNLVYVGGDRQPGPSDYGGTSWPNSIGAFNYSGRLFRGNAALPPATRWQHLTHRNDRGVAGGGTASNSAPHADSRDMDFDRNGRLIQADDGGVYCRTLPQLNTGDWFSLQGTLQTTEVHDVAYDSVSNKIIAGTQDNGVPSQKSNNEWDVLVQGDGGDVAVDDKTNAHLGQSIRYTSSQNLFGLRRRIYNSSGNPVSSAVCQLQPKSGSPAVQAQFYTPVELNRVNPVRLLIGAGNGIYESMDQGTSVERVLANVSVGDGLSGVGLAYGGRKDGTDYPEVVYAVDGNRAFVRTAAGPIPSTGVTLSTGGHILLDVAMDPDNYEHAFCVDRNQVFRTVDAGQTWTDVTGSLQSVEKSGDIRCVEFMPNSKGGVVCIGTQTGVYISSMDTPGIWSRFGPNLPASAYVYDIEYDAVDDVMVIGTLGRSVWMMHNASAASTGAAVAEWEQY